MSDCTFSLPLAVVGFGQPMGHRVRRCRMSQRSDRLRDAYRVTPGQGATEPSIGAQESRTSRLVQKGEKSVDSNIETSR